MKETQSPIEKLLDPDNLENIVLYNANDAKVEFEQIASIPVGEDMYVILSPVEPIFGVDEDEGVVFKIAKDDDGMQYLSYVSDPEMIDFVFDVYNKILDDMERAEEEEESASSDTEEDGE